MWAGWRGRGPQPDPPLAAAGAPRWRGDGATRTLFQSRHARGGADGGWAWQVVAAGAVNGVAVAWRTSRRYGGSRREHAGGGCRRRPTWPAVKEAWRRGEWRATASVSPGSPPPSPPAMPSPGTRTWHRPSAPPCVGEGHRAMGRGAVWRPPGSTLAAARLPRGHPPPPGGCHTDGVSHRRAAVNPVAVPWPAEVRPRRPRGGRRRAAGGVAAPPLPFFRSTAARPSLSKTRRGRRPPDRDAATRGGGVDARRVAHPRRRAAPHRVSPTRAWRNAAPVWHLPPGEGAGGDGRMAPLASPRCVAVGVMAPSIAGPPPPPPPSPAHPRVHPASTGGAPRRPIGRRLAAAAQLANGWTYRSGGAPRVPHDSRGVAPDSPAPGRPRQTDSRGWHCHAQPTNPCRPSAPIGLYGRGAAAAAGRSVHPVPRATQAAASDSGSVGRGVRTTGSYSPARLAGRPSPVPPPRMAASASTSANHWPPRASPPPHPPPHADPGNGARRWWVGE